MLRLAGLEPEVGAQRDGYERLELELRSRPHRVEDGRRCGVGLAVECEQGRTAPLAGEPLRPDGRSRCRADEHLAGAGAVLEQDRGGRGRPCDDELPVAPVDEEEVTGARVDPGLHPELDLADGAHRLARVLDEPLHLRRRAAGPLGVRVAREEHEERVAPELEDVAAAAVRDADQALEDAADREDQLLGACTTPRLEPLGEGGEAGQVDRDERAVELVPLLGRAHAPPSRERAVAGTARRVRTAVRPSSDRGYAFGIASGNSTRKFRQNLLKRQQSY